MPTVSFGMPYIVLVIFSSSLSDLAQAHESMCACITSAQNFEILSIRGRFSTSSKTWVLGTLCGCGLTSHVIAVDVIVEPPHIHILEFV